MTSLTAGAKLRASVINQALPLFAYATATTTRTSTTTMADGTGVVVALEADSIYIWDGFLAFNAGATGDARFAWTVPASTTGLWALNSALSTGSTGGVGTLQGSRIDGYGDANFLTAGGNDTGGGLMAVRPAGYIDTAGTAGNFQLRLAQNASSATSLVLQIGSWIRAVKVA
jgi:hypothetical protein